MKKKVEFKSLVGKELNFYGAWGNYFKLGPTVFQAIENPDDGYRSYLESIEVEDDVKKKVHFFSKPLGKVRIEKGRSIDGYILKDIKDSHIWLEVGTDYIDDYYPAFIFDYHPKISKDN